MPFVIKLNYMLWSAVVLLAAGIQLGHSATTHKHAHHHDHTKERTEDGVYRARDSHHHDEHGGHASEFDHESIIGSVKEAEEFDQLPPAEAKRRLAVLITQMDLNNDDHIDRHELKAHILRSFIKLAEEEANERFAEIDVDKDKIMTWAEYLKDTYAMESEEEILEEAKKLAPELQQSVEESRLIQDDREMFRAADLNHDGVLTEPEFKLFLSPEEFPEMFPTIIEQTLRDKDTNKDGRIDFQEFVGESAKDKDRAWLISEKDRFDSDYDTDGDGSLNRNEILSWIVPSNEEIAIEEVNHLFVSADDDHDDRLSYQEVIENYEVFVGSEATDYGDHLNKLKDEL